MSFPNQSPQNHTPAQPQFEAPQDERGREIHDMAARAPRVSLASPEVVQQLWKDDQIDKAAWLQMYTTIIKAALDAPGDSADLSECANLADNAYFYFHLKQNPNLRGGRR